MRPNLVLKSEALTDLTTEELGSVDGAQLTPSCPLVLHLQELLRKLTVHCDGPAR